MDEKYEYVALRGAAKNRRRTGRTSVEMTEQEGEELRIYHFPGPTKLDKLEQLYDLWFGCQKCELGRLLRCAGGNEEIVFCRGNPDADVMLIGEAPGEQEEEEKAPFVGASGQLLDILLAGVSDDPEIQELNDWYSKVSHTKANAEIFHEKVQKWRETEFFITNAVACRPPENRTPTADELKMCWERVYNMIYIVDPLLILAVGNTALSAVTRKPTAKITKDRGTIIDVTYDGKVSKLSYPVMPILHPSFLGRIADWRLKDGYWAKTMEDMRRAMRMVDFLRNQYYGTPIPQRR